MPSADIEGFVLSPRMTAGNRLYRGRLVLEDVQWTGAGEEAFATFTINADQLADAILNQLVWTDQSVQRGIRPDAPAGTSRELPVADGYPDPACYIFDSANADDIVDKLLTGARLFLNPLVWNLRPGEFEAYWSDDEASIFLYDGRVYLPDSHHRHQAILKAVLAAREDTRSSLKFNRTMQFKIELYFLSQEDEGNYFFDKNQRPRPTAMSKAYDLTTHDDLSVLAKRVIDKSENLQSGVNRVTDRLSKKTGHFVTLSTLREVMRTFADSEEVDETAMDGLAVVAARFLDHLSDIRPEMRSGIGIDRASTLASAAVMFHGYAALMRDYGLDVAEHGLREADRKWASRLQILDPSREVTVGSWSGDFFSKTNPVWEAAGITKRSGASGRLTVSNTGGTRARAGRILRRYLDADFETLAELGEV